MIYTDFHGEKLSLLGFGTMRLPLVPGGGPADVDEKTTADMVRYAMDHGVNYFDTAYPLPRRHVRAGHRPGAEGL